MVILFTCLMAGSLVGLYILDANLANQQEISFTDENGDLLIGTYYPGTKPYGALILEGFSSDQIAMKNIVSEFNQLGFHAFTFDFSGQARSFGTLGFDNAETDVNAKQALLAKGRFKALSGIPDSNLILIGHSMGGRVAIQAQTMDASPVAGVIAIGASINLGSNVQSEFFTGSKDVDLEWIQALNSTYPAVDILLVTGGWDDVFPPDAANLLLTKLQEGGSTVHGRSLEIIPATFHNYEIYSAPAIQTAKAWTIDLFSPAFTGIMANANITIIRGVLWAVFAISIFSWTFGMTKTLKQKKQEKRDEDGVSIINPKGYFNAKLLLWLGAAPLGFLICMGLFIIPIGAPVFNVIYTGFISGYGFLLFILYRKGRIWGIEGRWKPNILQDLNPIGKQESLQTITIIGGTIAACWLFFYTGINFLFPLNQRMIWLGIFTVTTFFGFYIAQYEATLLSNRKEGIKNAQLKITLIALFPFFIVTIFFAFLGSLSGMIGSIQGLFILAFVFSIGDLVRVTSRSKARAALFQAFLLQLLIGPQGALFALF